MVKAVLAVIGYVQVFPSVVIVVADASSLAPAAGLQSGLCSYVSECSVMIVVVKVIGGSFVRCKPFEVGSIDEENIGPSVVVIVEDCDTGSGGLR